MDKLITLDPKLSLGARLSQISDQCGMPICCACESVYNPPELKKVFSLGDGQPMSLDSILKEFEEMGFGCMTYSNAILVSTPFVKALDANPLDMRLDNFYFEGDHVAFLKKLRSLRIGANPHRSRVIEARYKIDIQKPVTVRDLLMKVSSEYGIKWNAYVSAEIPSYEFKNPDGTTLHATGPQVELVFWND
ncbi:hypothetical protein P4C99_21655 [Pontiellaceae bacterium B1224]|nr:hypothetical protein [Pontiellaceae bacterium B1224]